MSDNKKYYYLKLKDNFFDSDELIILESMPDGYLYSNILLKLYLRSLKNEGRLMFNDRIPFNPTMLAQVTRHSVGVVEKAVNTFQELGLIEVMDNGAIYVTDIQNYIGRSSSEADRKREYRIKIEQEKQVLLEGGQMSGQSSDKSPPERELEKEIELKKEINSSTRKKEKDNRSPNLVASFYENNNFGRLSPHIQERIIEMINDFENVGVEEKEAQKIMVEAMKESVENNVKKWAYAESIMFSWLDKGIKSVEEVHATKKEFESRKKRKNKKESVGESYGGIEY